LTTEINDNLEKLQNMEQEILKIRKKQTIIADLNTHGYETRLIDIIINLQDLNKKFSQFDKNNILNLIQDFRMYLSNTLHTFSKNVVDVNKSILNCDIARMEIVMNKIMDKMLVLEERIEKIRDKQTDVKVYINDKLSNTETIKDKLKLTIEDLNFSVRTSNLLRQGDVLNVGHLVKKKESDILQIRNCGRKSLNEIKQKLSELELSLGMV
jgi:uncharacterized protein (UPF0335 family)